MENFKNIFIIKNLKIELKLKKKNYFSNLSKITKFMIVGNILNLLLKYNS